MKDVRHWIDKTKQALDSPQNKKKPLRDQLTLREKILGDISIQKTKISMSVDKLNVSGPGRTGARIGCDFPRVQLHRFSV